MGWIHQEPVRSYVLPIEEAYGPKAIEKVQALRNAFNLREQNESNNRSLTANQ